MSDSIQDVMNDERGFPNPLHLSNPILINGEKVDSLSWDADKLTVDLYGEACLRATKGSQDVKFMESDYNVHLWIGCALIIADNQPITFTDLENGLKGYDIHKVMNLGRFFMMRAVAPDESTSDEPSDGTQESSTPQSET